MDTLSELEGAVLAQIGQGGPITAYAVARRFAASVSEYWSGSAGAVYPLIKRLAARQLLSGTDAQDGRRARTDYRLTAKGRKALKAWLLDAQRASDLGFDPLRTRLLHLEQCSPAERAQFLDDVEAALRLAANSPAPTDDPRLQALHAAVTQARVQWFLSVRESLAGAA